MCFVIGTILHEQDLLSELLEAPDWYRVKRKLLEGGKSLWPDMWSVEEIEKLKENYAAKGLIDLFYREYMNEVISREDAPFQRGRFKYCSRKDVLERLDRGERLRITMTVDPAYQTGAKHDYSAISVVATDSDNVMYIMYLLRERLKMDELIGAIFHAYERFTPVQVGIQNIDWDRVLMRPVKEEMRRRNRYFTVTPLKTYSKRDRGLNSKEHRILRLSPRYAMGDIVHIRGTSCLEAYETELLSFPRGKHDDLIDAVALQIDLLNPSKKKKKKPLRSWMGEYQGDGVSGY